MCLREHACARMHVCFSFNLVCVQARSLERPSLSVFSLAGRVGAECGSEKGPGSGPGRRLVRGEPLPHRNGPNEPFSFLPSYC